MTDTLLYKFLSGREATHVPGFRYHLKRWQPPVGGKLVPCKNGYHLLRPQDVAHWIGPDLYVAEYRGDEFLVHKDKVIVREARIVEHLAGWNERTQRLFAADCTERVLPLHEKQYPGDDRPRKAVEAARAYANGELDAKALLAAYREANDAAYAAATYAAATYAAAADYTAAARAAATTAAAAADYTAEREWQSARLLDYAHGRLA